MVSLSMLTHPASSPSPDGQDGRRPRSRNPSTWTVEDVVRFVKDADPQALGPHVELFRKHVCVWWAQPGGGARERHGRRVRLRELWAGSGSELSSGGTTQGGQFFSEHNYHLVCVRGIFVPSVPSFCPLTGVPVFLPIRPSICLCIQQIFIAYLLMPGKLLVPSPKLFED